MTVERKCKAQSKGEHCFKNCFSDEIQGQSARRQSEARREATEGK